MTLYKNRRNTENIAITSMRPLRFPSKPKMFAGCIRGESPKIFISEKGEKQKLLLDDALKQLIEKKITDVVILTCKTEKSSIISQYCSDGKYIFNGISFRFTTCRKFKGLEADAIIIVDVTKNSLCGNDNLSFYVGASRARFYLSIICQMSEDDCREALMMFDNSGKLVKRPQKALAAALNALLSS